MVTYQAYYKIATKNGDIDTHIPPFEAPHNELALALAKFNMRNYLPPRVKNMIVDESRLVKLVNTSTGEDVPLD